ncbi:DNA-binding transcriptional activator of the SARP family [Nonomuraea solani]|uniref:DNA-binding transcriptional activator of the SARP family n=1 Tax=Nonomuraea solani TaxID=1144553 RepID=A0A1H5XVY9_9ACTN|nr:BTAD domain-containing putative transcriptional regulator [Nonomuraea solani]SEG15838.1 DNA-binding transcriptional activator of the SARP family [Nonomuraea solani]
MVSGVLYRILGPVSVDGPDGPVELGSPKQRTVLAALLLNANRTVSDDRLAFLVWGERMPRTALARLQVYVHELRALLGKERISRVGTGYRIHAGGGEIDAELFDQHRAAAREHAGSGRPEMAARRLRAAAALWRGPALGGTAATLVEQERPGLEERRVGALEELFETELELGRHDEIVDDLRSAAAEHALRERLQAQLMLALHRCGRRPEALAVYRDTRERLIDELGIEPGQPLRELHQRFLADEAEQPAQTVHPAELPRDIHGFAGRERELAWLDTALGTGGAVCVLSGTAGMGKTALALRWAHRAKSRFPGGQLYVDLRGYDAEHEPLTAPAALARLLLSLGADPGQVPGGFDAQLGLYRSLLAGRTVLLFLDNARSAAQVTPLLPPSGAALVTSRQHLGELVAGAGARWYSLGALPERDGLALVDDLLGPADGPAEASARAELVRLCGGLPLALRIAAANAAAPWNGTASVVGELSAGDPLTGLTLDGTDHNPVTLAFSASYRVLSPACRRVFRLLGLIPGPDFTVEAVASAADVPPAEARTTLKVLAAAHLVEHHRADRFRLHDLVRLYAGAQAGGDPGRDAARSRLIDHYLRLGDAIAAWCAPDEIRLPGHVAPFTGDPVQPTGEEIATLVAALTQAVRHDPGPRTWRLAEQVWIICDNTGHHAGWLEIAPALLAAAERADLPALRAMLHYGMGKSLFRAVRREEAVHHLEQAAAIAAACGWREGEAESWACLSFALEWTGHLEQAIAHNRRAAALFTDLGSVAGRNRTLNRLGMQYHHLGRLECAERCRREALDLSREHGLAYAEAVDLRDLGSVLIDQGRYDEAERTLTQATTLLDALGSGGAANAHTWLSRLYWETGRWPAAQAAARHAVGLARGQGDRLVEAAALVAQADAEIRLGLLGDAAGNLDLADAISGQADLRWHQSYALVARARLHAARDDLDGAVKVALAARDTAHAGSYRLPELAALTELAALYTGLGDRAEAGRAAGDAVRLCRTIGHAPCTDRLDRLLG